MPSKSCVLVIMDDDDVDIELLMFGELRNFLEHAAPLAWDVSLIILLIIVLLVLVLLILLLILLLFVDISRDSSSFPEAARAT